MGHNIKGMLNFMEDFLTDIFTQKLGHTPTQEEMNGAFRSAGERFFEEQKGS